MDIIYYLDKLEETSNAEFNRIFSTLAVNFRTLQLNGFNLRLSSHKLNITDDILHVLCDFEARLLETENAPAINEIKGGYYGSEK